MSKVDTLTPQSNEFRCHLSLANLFMLSYWNVFCQQINFTYYWLSLLSRNVQFYIQVFTVSVAIKLLKRTFKRITYKSLLLEALIAL